MGKVQIIIDHKEGVIGMAGIIGERDAVDVVLFSANIMCLSMQILYMFCSRLKELKGS